MTSLYPALRTCALLPDLNRMPKLRSIDDVRPGHFYAIERIGVGIGLQTADFFQGREAGDHFTKDCVLAVLRRDGPQADIKLTSIGLTSGVDFVRQSAHCHGTGQMFSPNFGRQRVTGTTGPDSGPVLALAE